MKQLALIPPRLSILDDKLRKEGESSPLPLPPLSISIFTGHSHPFSPLLSLSVRIAAARCIVHNPPPSLRKRPSPTTARHSFSPSPPPSLLSGGKACFFSAAKREFILLIFIIGPEIYTNTFHRIIRNIIYTFSIILFIGLPCGGCNYNVLRTFFLKRSKIVSEIKINRTEMEENVLERLDV